MYGEEFAKPSDSTMTAQVEFENLLFNYPNPFNPITTINFSIKESGQSKYQGLRFDRTAGC